MKPVATSSPAPPSAAAAFICCSSLARWWWWRGANDSYSKFAMEGEEKVAPVWQRTGERRRTHLWPLYYHA
jgi:hypothetical protein